ncbi:MAG: SDR family NAD(P)-dependent oxidoreductase [Deltaproteobacteria bacterium]|nr:SDR family NAD(P)-dependent oxidoreductase [Deltaproteobacteria bacterium]
MPETLLVAGVRGLGQTLALHFARKGWRVLCAARTEADVSALCSAVTAAGGEAVAFPCDLTLPDSLEPLRREAIDLCIAAQTAGVRFGSKPLLEIDAEELDRSYATMIRGTWNLLQVVGPGMLERNKGTFLQMGTSSGVRTKEGFAGLGAIQHGLRALVQVAAREWRAAGVHAAYVVIDGGIASERTLARGLDPQRLVDPLEIARACEYLAAQLPSSWTHELVLRPARSDWTSPT